MRRESVVSPDPDESDDSLVKEVRRLQQEMERTSAVPSSLPEPEEVDQSQQQNADDGEEDEWVGLDSQDVEPTTVRRRVRPPRRKKRRKGKTAKNTATCKHVKTTAHERGLLTRSTPQTPPSTSRMVTASYLTYRCYSRRPQRQYAMEVSRSNSFRSTSDVSLILFTDKTPEEVVAQLEAELDEFEELKGFMKDVFRGKKSAVGFWDPDVLVWWAPRIVKYFKLPPSRSASPYKKR